MKVTNLPGYRFKGEVIYAAMSFPGSWHVTKLAIMSGSMYPNLLDNMTPPSVAVLGYSAFVVDSRVSGVKIVRAHKTNETKEVFESVKIATIAFIIQRVLTTEQQSTKWKIRALKAQFGAMRLPLSADSAKRKRLFTVCVCLLNGLTRLVGLKYIIKTYASRDTDSALRISTYAEETRGARQYKWCM